MIRQTHDEPSAATTASAASDASTPAAQVRVTPEELAKAISSLEMRKDAETQNTIRIGDAIRQLGLDTTPEEVLAEISAQRERAEAAQRAATFAAERSKLALTRKLSSRAVAIGGIFFLLFILLMSFRGISPPATVMDSKVAYVQPMSPVTVHETIAQVEDLGSFSVNSQTAASLIRGEASSDVLVTRGDTTGLASGHSDWTFNKAGSELYIHGFRSPKSADGTIGICNHREDMTEVGGLNYAQPVVLRLGSFNYHGMESTGSSTTFTISDVYPGNDPHARW